MSQQQSTPKGVPPNTNPLHVCKALAYLEVNVPSDMTDAERRRARAVVFRNKQFRQNQLLRVQFLGGSRAQHQEVEEAVMSRIAPLVNLRFQWGVSNGDIRISFDPNSGAWSYIGTDVYQIPPAQATMNLGWLDEFRRTR